MDFITDILWISFIFLGFTIEYQFGKYILTGSSTPVDKSEIHHSGAGRIVAVKMRPISLFESGESKGSVSLLELFEGKPLTTFDENEEFTLEDVAFLTCRGGWPISVISDKKLLSEPLQHAIL